MEGLIHEGCAPGNISLSAALQHVPYEIYLHSDSPNRCCGCSTEEDAASSTTGEHLTTDPLVL